MPITPHHRFGDQVIPFYGSQYPQIFEIERRCMDRDGKVTAYLDAHLPAGLVLDVGAGNGFTAQRLTRPNRLVVALEPDDGMVDREKRLVWSRGVAQDIPFHTTTFDAAYATWAFFFDGVPGIEQGLAELERVLRPGSPILIVDNAGNDAFCALSPRPIDSNAGWWQSRGFDVTIIETSYRFDSLEEANRLLSFYFGESAARENQQVEIGYNVAVYHKQTNAG